MQMPSLVKYFAFVGAALLGLISLANFLLEPSTGATVVQATAKPTPVVRHEPGASKIERWRNEQAALKAAAQAPTGENASLAAKSTPEPLRAVATASAQPAAVLAEPAALESRTASAQPVAAEPDPAVEQAAAEAARLKAEKAKAAKAAKKARLARERAKAEQAARESGQFYAGTQQPGQFFAGTQQRSASNQQDQYYYGQRFPQRQFGYASAPPQRSFGPFGW
jgi:hypothetical protein